MGRMTFATYLLSYNYIKPYAKDSNLQYPNFTGNTGNFVKRSFDFRFGL